MLEGLSISAPKHLRCPSELVKLIGESISLKSKLPKGPRKWYPKIYSVIEIWDLYDKWKSLNYKLLKGSSTIPILKSRLSSEIVNWQIDQNLQSWNHKKVLDQYNNIVFVVISSLRIHLKMPFYIFIICNIIKKIDIYFTRVTCLKTHVQSFRSSMKESWSGVKS